VQVFGIRPCYGRVFHSPGPAGKLRTKSGTAQVGSAARDRIHSVSWPAVIERIGSVKEWIACEDNCLKCSYGATLDCDGDCPRCPRNTYCPCVTFISFSAGKLAPAVTPMTTTFDRPRKR